MFWENFASFCFKSYLKVIFLKLNSLWIKKSFEEKSCFIKTWNDEIFQLPWKGSVQFTFN